MAADYDLAEAVQTLEAKGIRVIGRLVAFRDPIYAEAAWAAGRHDEVLQTPSGGMLGTYGGFSNYANEAVRQYNLDIVLEAVDLGVKDILWDYIRRPEGDPDTMVVPGLEEPELRGGDGLPQRDARRAPRPGRLPGRLRVRHRRGRR